MEKKTTLITKHHPLLFAFDDYEVYPVSKFHFKTIVDGLTESLLYDTILTDSDIAKNEIDFAEHHAYVKSLVKEGMKLHKGVEVV